MESVFGLSVIQWYVFASMCLTDFFYTEELETRIPQKIHKALLEIKIVIQLLLLTCNFWNFCDE